MNTAHPFSKPVLHQRTSPFLQEKLVQLGCDEVFGEVPCRISSLLGISVSQSQVYRTCQNVAMALDESELNTPEVEVLQVQDKANEQVYAMVDGSMLFTDEGWQEIKVGRVFQAEHYTENEEDKWRTGLSQYVAKRGHYTGFTSLFEKMLRPGSACKKIFVTDGATWIGQWIEQQYKGSTHIIDIFHVLEKLAAVAPADKGHWLDKQRASLLNSKVEAVIESLKRQYDKKEEVTRLIGYMENHKHQMDYLTYRQNGWMIGSGAIESTHRTLLQVRMKRSGQRWADDGCDNMIKLRVVYKNGKNNLVRNLLKKTA